MVGFIASSVMTLTRVEQLKNTDELLSGENVKTVVLVGKTGVDKTWMARKLSDRASREEQEDKEEEENGESLQLKISAALERKRLLLILDDEGNQINEVGALLPFYEQRSAKVLFTTINRDGIHKSEGNKIVIEVKPLSMDESLSLLQERAGATVYELPGIKPLAETFIKKNNCLPAAIIMLAKALTYVGQQNSAVGTWKVL